MTDIRDFITERLDDDERVAREAIDHLRCGCHPDTDPSVWRFNGEDSVRHSQGIHDVVAGASWGSTYLADEIGAHIALHDPARVLRDVEAKRRILALAEHLDQSADVDAGPAAMELWRLLAMPYAGHPEFRAEWTA